MFICDPGFHAALLWQLLGSEERCLRNQKNWKIPKSISHRLSNNYSNIDICYKNKHIYDNTLKNSDYKQTLEYIPPKS